MAKVREIDLTGAEDETPQEEQGDELASVLAELGGKGVLRWNIYCLSPKEKYGHVATWESGEEVSIARIAKEFGAGEFRVRAFDERGRVAGGKNVKISALLEAKAKKEEIVQAQPQGLGMMEMLTFMNTSQANQQAAARDMMQQMMQMQMQAMQSQTALLTAVLGRPQASNGLDAPALISMMSGMRDMVAPKSDGVETLLKGLELGRSLEGGGSDGGTDFMTIAAKGLDVISNVVRSGNTLAPQRTRRPAQLPQPKPIVASVRREPQTPQTPVTQSVTQAVEKTPEEKTMLAKLQWIKAQTGALVIQAKRDSSPELYAAVFVDNIPNGITDEEILLRFQSDDAVAQLAALDSRVNEHREWFENFRQAVIEQMTDDEDEDEDDEHVEDEDEDDDEHEDDADREDDHEDSTGTTEE